MIYGELVEFVGLLNVVCVVGNVMWVNCYFLIVFCYWVVGVNGLGGYFGVDGLMIKW